MPAPSNSPRRVGAYELLRLIGTGGTGAVYLARRADGVLSQRVAVKLLRPGSASPAQIETLVRERQVQANLEHPGIARLIDGGQTDDGLPFLVQEYIEGVPLDAWCDENRLGLRTRIELFVAVCAAVDHAHQRLVVHRDLKPLNVLVNTEGKPKLLDFGVAKALDAEKLAASADMTVETVMFLSPAYASPEQLRGRPITKASDQYSLGVMLFELLSGCRPHELDACSPAEIARIVSSEDPPRASRLVRRMESTTAESVARQRDTTPARLARDLSGDLDRVLAKAIAPEPTRRYESARAFAEDLERFLAGESVHARGPSPLYRSARFLARNRLAVALGLLALCALGLSLDRSLLSLARARGAEQAAAKRRVVAEQRLDELQDVSTRLITDLFKAVIGLPDSERAAELVMRTGAHYIQELEGHGRADARMLQLLSQANYDLADILRRKGAPHAEVRERCERSLAFAERMWRADAGALEPGIVYARAAAAYADELHAFVPVSATLDRATARLASCERTDAGRLLAAEIKLAEVRQRILRRADRGAEAVEVSRGALAALDAERELPARTGVFFDGIRARLEIFLAHNLLLVGENEEALVTVARGAERLERASGSHAPNTFVTEDRMLSESVAARALAALGRHAEALEHIPANDHETHATPASALLRAEVLLALERADEARVSLDQARAELDRSTPTAERHYRRISGAESYLDCARLERAVGRPANARACVEAALFHIRGVRTDTPGDVRALLVHGEALVAQLDLPTTDQPRGPLIDFLRETLEHLRRATAVETPRMRSLAAALERCEDDR